MTHDGLLAQIDAWIQEDGDDYPILGLVALRAVVELTNNLQDTESWQDNAEYNAGYNNAMYDVLKAIKEQLK